MSLRLRLVMCALSSIFCGAAVAASAADPTTSSLLAPVGLQDLLQQTLGGPQPQTSAAASPDDSAVYSIATADGLRYYRVHVPRNLTASSAVVIALHGGSQSYNVLDDSTSPQQVWRSLSDEFGFLLIVPSGTNPTALRSDPNWARGPYNNKYWNDCRGDASGKSNNVDDVGFIAQLIQTVPAARGVMSGKVYIAGASNGALMAQRVALERPDLVRAVGAALTSYPGVDVCHHVGTPVPMIMVKGEQDTILPYNGNLNSDGSCPSPGITGCILPSTVSVQRWVTASGATGSVLVEAMPNLSTADSNSLAYRESYLDGAVPVVFYRITNAGHVEPSPTHLIGSFGELLVGNQNQDFETYRVFWDFFRSIN